MAKKIGEDHAREMFRKGLNELREIGYFSGSNIAQPNYHGFYGNREQTREGPQPERNASPEQGPAIEHER
jgi:hypothetical protein